MDGFRVRLFVNVYCSVDEDFVDWICSRNLAFSLPRREYFSLYLAFLPNVHVILNTLSGFTLFSTESMLSSKKTQIISPVSVCRRVC